MREKNIFKVGAVMRATFTAATTDIITSNGHGLENGDVVQFTTSDTLPAGLSTATDYYIIEATTNTFKVSTASGGPSVDITDTGTGTHTYTLKGRVLLVENHEHLQLGLFTANSANFTVKVAGSDQEDAPDFLAAQSATNRFDYLDIVDLEDKSSIDGDTGFALAGSDDNRQFEVNVSGKRWLTMVVTAYTAGNLEAKAVAYKKY